MRTASRLGPAKCWRQSQSKSPRAQLRRPEYQDDNDGLAIGEEKMGYLNENLQLLKGDIDNVVGDLDVKLNRVLKKHEHDYLKGYSVYVKQKERELRELVTKLND